MTKLRKYDIGYVVPDETKTGITPVYGYPAVCAAALRKRTKDSQKFKYLFGIGGMPDTKTINKYLRNRVVNGGKRIGFAKRQYFLKIPDHIKQLELPCVIAMHYVDEIKRQHENTEEDQFRL